MSRKFAGISLLICLVAPILALFIWTQHQKHEVRRTVKWRMAANLDKDEMVLLKFTDEEADSQLRWKHSKEFEFHNSMYDIVQKELHGDTTYYYCWLDKEETSLNQQLDELAALAFGKDPKQKEKKEKVNSFYKHWFHSSTRSVDKTFCQNALCYSIVPKHCSSLHASPPVPPPQRS